MTTKTKARAKIGPRHLRAAQAALGYTGVRMAEVMEVSPRQYGHYLQGKTPVPRLRWRAVSAELRERRLGADYERVLRESAVTGGAQ